MEAFQYRGRKLNKDDIAFIQTLIAANPAASRRALSQKLCQAWNWMQPNGTLSDMICRSLMLELERAGHIVLPRVRWTNPNPLARRRKPDLPQIDTTPLSASLSAVRPLEFRLVRRTPEEPVFNGLLEHYHFLGYTQPVGEHLKYLVYGAGGVVACLAWSSAPRHLGPRDRFIRWTAEARRRNIRFIAYNTRFLIPPWIHVAHLASHILGRMPLVLSRDWERIYGHPIYFLETFIDPARSRGTCYRAANWIPLGLTTGRGKDSQSKKPNRSIKEVLGYPVWKRFRELLGDIG
jgi:hypothetical protein